MSPWCEALISSRRDASVALWASLRVSNSCALTCGFGHRWLSWETGKSDLLNASKSRVLPFGLSWMAWRTLITRSLPAHPSTPSHLPDPRAGGLNRLRFSELAFRPLRTMGLANLVWASSALDPALDPGCEPYHLPARHQYPWRRQGRFPGIEPGNSAVHDSAHSDSTSGHPDSPADGRGVPPASQQEQRREDA